MGRIISLIEGLSIGALAMYFYDPQRGNSRRAMVKDKLDAVYNSKLEAKNIMVKDTVNRVKGLACKTKARLSFKSPDDEKLLERIRASIGHVVSHPGALSILVESGKVRVSGPILASESEMLVDAIWSVDGVAMIEHRLNTYDSPDHVSALQGEIISSRANDDWTPTIAMAMCLTGGVLTLFGMTRGGVVGKTLGAAGVGLIAKAFGDVESKSLTLQKKSVQ